MKARITDAQALRAITPSAMAAYVRAEGWEKREQFGKHSDVFVRTGVGELILPGIDDLADYDRVVQDIIAALAQAENRDELQIYRDLVGADRDVVRVRAPEAEDDGSVPIDAGVEIVQNARDMLLSAACSASAPRAAYRAGSVKEANDYMNRVRLGQTEHGSFIVTLLAPVPPSLISNQANFWPEITEEPYERLVTRRLVDGLAAARSAAEGSVRGEGIEAFREVVPLGVSANLCEALSELIEVGEGLEVSVTWSKTRGTPEPRRRVSFSRNDSEILKEAARLFRSSEPRPNERLFGYVGKLDRGVEAKDGKISVKTFLDGQPVSVTTTLGPDLYSTAVDAHEARKSVVISGDLRKVSHRWVLENPRDLSVSQSDDD